MIEAISQTKNLIEIGSFGGVGYSLGLLNRVINKKLDYGHDERKLSMQLQSRMFKESIEDTQDARKYKFKFARRIIAFSLFLMMPILLFLTNFFDKATAIPVQEKSSYLWGLMDSTTNKLQEINAYYYDPVTFLCLSSMVVGFYFGQKSD